MQTVINKQSAFQLKPDPFAGFKIPESWNSLQEFSDWWVSNGMPIIFPVDPEVFLSDDATAICLFRKGRFQVELYLIHPKPMVPTHEHPGVQVIKVRMGKELGALFSGVLQRGESHGSGMKLEAEQKGFPLFAIQYWEDREPTTIASMWKGNTAGPKHEAIIKRFNPNCFIENGYADVTRNSDGSPKSNSF